MKFLYFELVSGKKKQQQKKKKKKKTDGDLLKGMGTSAFLPRRTTFVISYLLPWIISPLKMEWTQKEFVLGQQILL